MNLKLERHNNMLIEINGKVTELTRVTGINTKLETVKASDIESSSILMKVPYKYVPEVHDPIIESLFAEHWKSMWDPDNIQAVPEAGSWEVGISVTSVVEAYINYFVKKYWGSNTYLSFIGCDAFGKDSVSLATVDVYGTISMSGLTNMLRAGTLDRAKFEERYNKWLADNTDVDYRGAVDIRLSNDVIEGIDPCVWEQLLLSSRVLMEEAGEDPDLVAVFTKFLNECGTEIKSSIYVLSPSERASLDPIANM